MHVGVFGVLLQAWWALARLGTPGRPNLGPSGTLLCKPSALHSTRSVRQQLFASVLASGCVHSITSLMPQGFSYLIDTPHLLRRRLTLLIVLSATDQRRPPAVQTPLHRVTVGDRCTVTNTVIPILARPLQTSHHSLLPPSTSSATVTLPPLYHNPAYQRSIELLAATDGILVSQI